MKRALAICTAVVAACVVAPAVADPYNFTFVGANGALIASGTLATDGSRNALAGSYNGTGDIGSTVVALNGMVLGQPLSIVPDPYAPGNVQAGSYIGDNQIILNGPVSLDEGGLVVRAGTYGYGNILGSAFQTFDAAGSRYLFLLTNATPRVTGGTFTLAAAGDATSAPGGTQTAPTQLGATVTNIAGQIGPTDPQQFYTFRWNGGQFSSAATVTGALSSDVFAFDLFGMGKSLTVGLDASNTFMNTISTYLAAGQYTIGLLGTVPIDPDFTISFNQNVSAVPESGSWALMLVGLGCAGAALRRRRTGLLTEPARA